MMLIVFGIGAVPADNQLKSSYSLPYDNSIQRFQAFLVPTVPSGKTFDFGKCPFIIQDCTRMQDLLFTISTIFGSYIPLDRHSRRVNTLLHHVRKAVRGRKSPGCGVSETIAHPKMDELCLNFPERSLQRANFVAIFVCFYEVTSLLKQCVVFVVGINFRQTPAADSL